MSTEIETVRTSQLVDIAPFVVNYTSAKVVQKVSKEGRKYPTIEVEIAQFEQPDTKFIAVLFSGEYKSIVSLGRDLDAIGAEYALNQKTGQTSVVFYAWRKK